jgi:hypothetical protein
VKWKYSHTEIENPGSSSSFKSAVISQPVRRTGRGFVFGSEEYHTNPRNNEKIPDPGGPSKLFLPTSVKLEAPVTTPGPVNRAREKLTT